MELRGGSNIMIHFLSINIALACEEICIKMHNIKLKVDFVIGPDSIGFSGM